jgi:hypothetical protein
MLGSSSPFSASVCFLLVCQQSNLTPLIAKQVKQRKEKHNKTPIPCSLLLTEPETAVEYPPVILHNLFAQK